MYNVPLELNFIAVIFQYENKIQVPTIRPSVDV